MTKKTITTLLILALFACKNSEQSEHQNSVEQTVETPKRVLNLSDSTYQTEVGWGYDIKQNGKPYIHQPHIPSVGGNQGFSTQAKAEKAASFVRYKIENNIMPPSVSPEELDSLGVLD
ncbi:MAG: DUF4907 domain-containing protein [Saprospiraceae bacterium]